MERMNMKIYLLLVASVVCSAFGGLQPIAILQWLQPLFLLQFLHRGRVLDRKPASVVGLLILTLFSQTAGYTISYLGEFNDPDFNLNGIVSSIVVSFVVWVIVLFVFISTARYEQRFPAAVLSHPFAFPVIYTCVWHASSSFSPIGTTGNPAYTQYAIQPIVLTAALWGLDGIVFFMALTASLIHQRLQLREEASQNAWKVTTGIVVSTTGGKGSIDKQSANAVDDQGDQDPTVNVNANAKDAAATHHKLEIQDDDGDREPLRPSGSRRGEVVCAKPTVNEFARTVKRHERLVKIWCWVLVLSLLYSGCRQVVFSDRFFMKGIIDTAKPTVPVSCILRQPDDIPAEVSQRLNILDGPSKEFLYNSTAARIRAGDKFIVWSETATVLDGDQGEKELLSRVREILSMEQEAKAQHSKLRQWTDKDKDSSIRDAAGPYLGLSYSVKHEQQQLWQPNSSSNVFTLMLPDGSVGFRYRKSHPVPFVEQETVAGPEEIYTVDTPYGTIGGAICFDLQFPRLLEKAGYMGVDILLQPSWTWGPMANQQLKADAFRAVENGFTLMRCSSMGQSAVVTPFNEIIDVRDSTGTSVVTMQLPIAPKKWTLYPYGGFMFGILVALVAAKYLFMAWLPLAWVLSVSSFFPGAINVFFVGDTFEEEVIGNKTYRRFKTTSKSSGEWTVARRPSLLPTRSLSSRS